MLEIMKICEIVWIRQKGVRQGAVAKQQIKFGGSLWNYYLSDGVIYPSIYCMDEEAVLLSNVWRKDKTGGVQRWNYYMSFYVLYCIVCLEER